LAGGFDRCCKTEFVSPTLRQAGSGCVCSSRHRSFDVFLARTLAVSTTHASRDDLHDSLSSGRSSHRRSRLVHTHTTHRMESTTATRPNRPNTRPYDSLGFYEDPLFSPSQPPTICRTTPVFPSLPETLTPALPRPTRPARHHHTVSSPRPRILSPSLLFASLLRERTMPPRSA
jgi:hypothetical protein